MGINMKRMRQSYEDQQKGGEFLKFDQGETLVYIHPPCRGDDDKWMPTTGLPYVPIVVHYNVGKDNAMVVSLDPERNDILEHPFIKTALKKRKIELTGECPLAAEIESGAMSDEEADDCRPQTKYLWGMTPLKVRQSSRDEWASTTPRPSVAMVGKQIYDGVMEAFFDNGDITDMDGAVLLRIIKKGKDRLTKYEVKAEPSSLKKPFKMPEKLRAVITKALSNECDLFNLAANLIKGPSEVEALLGGVKTSSDPDDDDDEAPKKPAKPKAKTDKPKDKPKGKPNPKEPDPEEDEASEDDDLDLGDDDDDSGDKAESTEAAADDDDLGLDDLKAALGDIDEEDPPAKPKGKSGKK